MTDKKNHSFFNNHYKFNKSYPLEYEFNRARICVYFILFCFLFKFLGGNIFGQVFFTCVVFLQLWFPYLRGEDYGLGFKYVGLHFKNIRTDIKLFCLVSLLIFPFYILGAHLFFTWLPNLDLPIIKTLQKENILLQPGVRFSLPSKELVSRFFMGKINYQKETIFEVFLLNYLVYGLFEEGFYRGYLQPHYEAVFKKKGGNIYNVWGANISKATLWVCFLFALGHFIGEWNVFRLLTFFPALIFAWLRNKSGTIISALLFHGSCNMLSYLLPLFYLTK